MKRITYRLYNPTSRNCRTCNSYFGKWTKSNDSEKGSLVCSWWSRCSSSDECYNKCPTRCCRYFWTRSKSICLAATYTMILYKMHNTGIVYSVVNAVPSITHSLVVWKSPMWISVSVPKIELRRRISFEILFPIDPIPHYTFCKSYRYYSIPSNGATYFKNRVSREFFPDISGNLMLEKLKSVLSTSPPPPVTHTIGILALGWFGRADVDRWSSQHRASGGICYEPCIL